MQGGRHFLFLQGIRSPFFWRLAQSLRACGPRVSKVHFNAGDVAYWRGSAVHCKASHDEMGDFYKRLLDSDTFTDIVLFGDCRPVHTPAIMLARERGLVIHVFEEGYFRPDWITLEKYGVNGHSSLPKEASWYLAAADLVQDIPRPTPLPASMRARVIHDVAYNLCNVLNPVFFPQYPNHVEYPIAKEYVSYVKKAWQVIRKREIDHITVDRLAREGDYFLLALQVSGDAQLRFHSSYADQEKFMTDVVEVFAAHAPADSSLVIKRHPLDPGLTDHRAILNSLMKRLDLGGRIHFLETGHLPTLLDHATGLITVNSTTIGQALFHRCPVMALGKSIFGVDGLIFKGSLDAFWSDPGKVDVVLFQAFQKVVTYATQINGGLHQAEGIKLGVQHATLRLLEPRSRISTLSARLSWPMEKVA